ncbi:MAG: amidohydrolase family protein [Candidatus Syntropharchaeia archaeon]
MKEEEKTSEESLREIKAIDVMNYPWYASKELVKKMFKADEYKMMAKTTFKTVLERMGPGTPDWMAVGALTKSSLEEVLQEMDEAGFEYVIMSDIKMWSYRRHFKLIMGDPADGWGIETVKKMVDESDGRIVGGVGYNPFRIKESLQEIKKAVEDYGFKYVYMHPITFGVPLNDKKLYPVYALCEELGVPIGMQVGHSAEPLPSEPGHPMYADEVAIDFPDLKMVLSHTGWPWIEEWCSMIWRHPNVYGDISAYMPRNLEPYQVKFMDTRGRDKVLFGTNGFGLKTCKEQFLQLPIKEETKRKVLRENALKLFDL